jgi:GNAT superfamily N-acetyltransferase
MKACGEGGDSTVVDSQKSNTFIDVVRLALKTGSPVNLLKRILTPHQKHCFVYGKKFCGEVQVPVCEVEMEFREITAADSDTIDELTAIDEWHISKSFTLRKLEEGEHIYIAKHQGKIVASQSIVTRENFQDPFLDRELTIARDEAYLWRAFCVPAFRGRGIFPVLERYYLADMALKYGRSTTLATILTTNKSSQRMAAKAGRVKVGRAGFVEIFGIRFHYLWGREAFKETSRRFLVQAWGRFFRSAEGHSGEVQ